MNTKRILLLCSIVAYSATVSPNLNGGPLHNFLKKCYACSKVGVGAILFIDIFYNDKDILMREVPKLPKTGQGICKKFAEDYPKTMSKIKNSPTLAKNLWNGYMNAADHPDQRTCVIACCKFLAALHLVYSGISEL
jgi:hypothetical protein